MKMPQTKIKIAPGKLPKLSAVTLKPAAPKTSALPKPKAAALPSSMSFSKPKAPGQARPVIPAAPPVHHDYAGQKETTDTVTRIKQTAQMELDQIHRMRMEATRYQQETVTRARSDAQSLMLHARLETQKEVEAIIRQANEEIQKVLADIRVIRITAQEELAAQRKFTDAARLSNMSQALKEEMAKASRKKKQLIESK